VSDTRRARRERIDADRDRLVGFPEKVARALGGSDALAGAERGLGAGAAAFLQTVTLHSAHRLLEAGRRRPRADSPEGVGRALDLLGRT